MSVWWHPRPRSASVKSCCVIGAVVDHGTPPPWGGVTSASYRVPIRLMVIGISAILPPGGWVSTLGDLVKLHLVVGTRWIRIVGSPRSWSTVVDGAAFIHPVVYPFPVVLHPFRRRGRRRVVIIGTQFPCLRNDTALHVFSDHDSPLPCTCCFCGSARWRPVEEDRADGIEGRVPVSHLATEGTAAAVGVVRRRLGEFRNIAHEEGPALACQR